MAAGLVVSLAMTLAEVVERPASAVAAPVAQVEPLPVLERPDEQAALITARMTGQKVRITGLTTDTSAFVALPDGRVEGTIHPGPVRMRHDNVWIPIDLTLRAGADGSVRAVAHPSELWISGARDAGGDLASIGSGERRLALGWPGALPTPVLQDNRATYPDVVAGIDLVVAVTRTGFEQFVIVKERAAVDRLPSLELPLTGEGLGSVSQDSSGDLTLKDASGKAVATVPAPEMWDAQRAPGSEEPTRRKVVTATAERPSAARGIRAADGFTMRLEPDLAWLKDPATQFPVTIDPQINPLYTSFDTYVKEGDTVGRSGANDLHVGLLSGSPNVKSRAFVHWGTSALAGKQITAATVNFWNFWSHTCTATSWEIWSTGAASSASRWDTQPSWLYKEATSTQTKGGSSCADGWVSIDGRNFFQRAATAGRSTAYMGVRGTDETTVNSFKQFRSRNAADSSQVPYATVTYNSYPTVGTRSTVPSTACVTGSSRPKVNTATPQLAAVISDAETSSVTAEFEWWQVGGSAKIGSTVTATAASGAAHTATVPSGAFVHDGSYMWRVRGNDGTVNGSWSSWCEFTVDTSVDAPPIISSQTYPENAWGGDANVAADFTFSPNGVTDAVAYEYSLDVQPVNKTVNTASQGASATVSIKPTTPGWHTVFARTRDATGNVSDLRQYPFKVGSAAISSPETGDFSGAKTAITAEASPSITSVTYQWRRAGSDSWSTIPTGDVTYAAGGETVTWPIPISGGVVPKVNWDIAATLAAVDAQGIPRDGPVQLRGQFNGAGVDPIKFTFDRNLASADTAEIGPGSANLITGNYQIGQSDVSVFGLSVARTLNTRQPGGVDPLFGPGWVSGVVVPDADAPYTKLTVYNSLVQVGLPDESTIGFAKITSSGSTFEPQVGAESYTLTYASASNSYTLADGDGNITIFTRSSGDPSGVYVPTSVTSPGSGNTITYSWEKVTVDGQTVMRPTRVLTPVPTDATCTTLVKGCKALTFTYATATTATGTIDGTWGDYLGRVNQISYTAWDPDLATPAMHTVVTTRYAYDNTGRLRAAWDPRLDWTDSSGTHSLRVVYAYDADGILTTMTPPGQEPWQFTYAALPDDPGKGRLYKVTRSVPSAGTAVDTVVYRVPLSGSGAPYDLSATQTSRWGQTEQPTDATAVFPANQVPTGNPATGTLPSSYERATVSYLDANARTVNTAQPGGYITATWYDNYGNVTRDLTAGNRARALNASASDTAIQETALASSYSTHNVYSDDGQRQQYTLEPEHDIMLDSGQVVRGRGLTKYTYDQGAPSTGGPYNLVTTQITGVRYWTSGGAEVDADLRTTTTDYDWSLRQPTVSIVDPGGLDLTTRTTYDASGKITSTTAPAGGSVENTPSTRKTTYYTAAANSTYPECGNRAEWDGLVCRVDPGGQPDSGPELPAAVTTYDMFGQPRTVIEKTTTGTLRTTAIAYDAAGRLYETQGTAASGLGEPVERRRVVYDPTTGQPVKTQTINGTGAVTAEIMRAFDTLGRMTSYTDADGNVSTTTYDLLSRPATIDDGKATRTYTYDGGAERRGVPTQLVDSQAGTFTGSYDADGNLTGQTWPNGVGVGVVIDESGAAVGISYTMIGCGQPDCTLFTETATSNVHGQRKMRTSTLSTDEYSYDQAGRLTAVQNTALGDCTTRVYDYDAATNRTGLTIFGSGVAGACQTSTVTSSRTSTYDTADRTVDTGYAYDALGRTKNQPAADSTVSSGDTQMTYHTNDMVRSITQGTRTATYTLDVIADRIRSWNDTANSVTKTNHYSGDGDSPAWIDEGNNNMFRPIAGVVGIVGIFGNTTGVAWQIANLHGDFVAGMAETETGLSYVSEYSDHGIARNSADAGSRRYGYLGAYQRAADTPDGSILMGVRLYNPTTSRFQTVDPVYGGNANPYEYCVGDPANCTDISGQKRISMSCATGRYPKWSCYFLVRYSYWETRALRWYLGVASLVAQILGIVAGVIGKWPGVVFGILVFLISKAYEWIRGRIKNNHCVTLGGGFGVSSWFVPWAWAWPSQYRCR